MFLKLLITLFMTFVFSLNSFASSNTPQELLESFSTCIKTKDVKRVQGLFLWKGSDPEFEVMTKKELKKIVNERVVSDVSLGSLKDDDNFVHVLNGYKYYPNVEVKGYLKLVFEGDDFLKEAKFYYGIFEGKYYLANTIKEKLTGDFTEQKNYNIMVGGMSSDSSLIKFDGEVTYLLNSKIEKRDISGQHNKTFSIWADEILECRILNKSDGIDLDLTIAEGFDDFYKSETVPPNEEMYYKKGM